MLQYQLLKNHAGIMLCGDYTTLKVLHEVVHEVNENSPIIKNKEGIFLGLAYDARKAYEGQRETIKAPKHFEEIGIRYGVKILWPVLLLQSRMLRTSLGFFDNSKRQQAIAFSLESVIESAINDDFGTNGLEISERWLRIDPTHPYAEEHLDSRGAQFCMWSKAERKRNFAGLLASFDPMYPFFYEQSIRAGIKGLISPTDLDDLAGTEWVDPKA